ncbi:MAG: hypothetical protein ACYDDF_01625 [Thermoplasmatota archaeon]
MESDAAAPAPDRDLALWCLGTFHTCVFFLLFLGGGLALHALDGLAALGDVGTALGSSIFVIAWVVLFFLSRRALRGVPLFASPPPWTALVGRGVQWGVIAGLVIAAAFLLFGFVILVGINLHSIPGLLSDAAVLLIGGVIGGAVASIVGAIVGVLLFALDAIGLALSTGLGDEPGPRDP